jgi:glycogen debranching enzyme
MIDFGRDICNTLPAAESREWLVTNGLGGFACGTVSGLLTRRYHGLLIAALQPPLGRTLLLSKLDETATYQQQPCALFANRWADQYIDPRGYYYLERFHLEGATPVWTFACADALLEKRIWMQPQANTTYIHYTLQRATAPLSLFLKALVNYRGYHNFTQANNWQMRINPVSEGLQIIAYSEATPFYLLSRQATATPRHDWYRNFYLQEEADRGLEATDDHLYAGAFQATLSPGESVTVVASTQSDPPLEGSEAYAERQAYEQNLINQGAKLFRISRPKADAAGRFVTSQQPVTNSSQARNLYLPRIKTTLDEPKPSTGLQQLALAADQFIVSRPLPDNSQGRSIIAGYPWFGDWGRDTMIALPGLTLVTGRPEVAKQILITFSHFVSEGMLPNRFPDTGQKPEYNTADAALWYFHAISQYLRYTKDKSLIKMLYPVLEDIIERHRQGTRYNIHVDSKDGLLYAGEPGHQLTWMDAKVGDWVVTPRIGKPVEINALWHNALQVMALFSKHVGKSQAVTKRYKEQAKFVAENFRQRFWYEAGGYLCDVIDGPGGDPGYDGKLYDRRLRPNQILAVSLPFKLLTAEQAKSVVDICARHLLTPYGLRSLAPNQPSYTGHYGGGQYERDGAYHQGAVWAWLIGPFAQAHLHVYQNRQVAQSFLLPLMRHLSGAGVGNISEIFDGDPPFTPRGCFAQAWSVAQVLEAWHKIVNYQ